LFLEQMVIVVVVVVIVVVAIGADIFTRSIHGGREIPISGWG